MLGVAVAVAGTLFGYFENEKVKTLNHDLDFRK